MTKAETFTSDGKINPKWLDEKEEVDPLLSRCRAYFLPGSRIKPDIQCGANECGLLRRSAAQPAKKGKCVFAPMCFCYFCNRTYHIQCLGLDLDSFCAQSLPIQCEDCKMSVQNRAAKTFYAQDKYASSVEARRNALITAVEQEHFETDDEFDESDVQAFAVSQHDMSSAKPTMDELIQAAARQHAKRAEEEIKALRNQLETERIEARREGQQLADALRHLTQQLGEIKRTAGRESLNDFYGTKKVDTPETEKDAWEDLTCQQGQSKPSTSSKATPLRSQEQQKSTLGTKPRTPESLDDGNSPSAMERMAASQERTENDRYLSTLRKAMGKIVEFDGDALKWLEFKHDVERYRTVGKYDDNTIKEYLRTALKGDAYNKVKDVIDYFELDRIMDILRRAFGDPMRMVRRRAREIEEAVIPSVLYHEDAENINVLIQGYFAACAYAKTGVLNSNRLGERLYEQLNPEDQARCKEMFERIYDSDNVVICLKVIYEYLDARSRYLADRPITKKQDTKRDDKNKKPIQLHSVSTDSTQVQPSARPGSSNQRNEAYKFEIRDKATAPYMGYDMSKVNLVTKRCEICNRAGHFSLQCNQFAAMDENQRSKVVYEKKLCRNCLLTTSHRSSECDLKLGCGFRVNQTDKCAQKHHISIHGASRPPARRAQTYGRRNNTNANSRNVQQALDQAQNQAGSANPPAASGSNVQAQMAAVEPASSGSSAHFHTQAPRTFTILQNNVRQETADKYQRTVKMFKHKFFGPKGYTVAFSIGDSGAEGTLVSEDLRQALGIEGVPHELSLSWTDGKVKKCMAIKFDLEVQGILSHSQKLTLRDCFAIQDLDPPARTLDMKEMREKFPYLRDVDFDGYQNEQPVMLIGSPHAFAIESIKGLIRGDHPGCPVALESLLGITVYGGNPLDYESQHLSVNMAATTSGEEIEEDSADTISNQQLHDLLVDFNSVQSLGIRANENRLTDKEKSAIAILEEEMRELKNGAIEVPLIWNRQDKTIPQLPNNFAMVYKRQLAQEAKLQKNPEHLQIYNDNVTELIRLGYMRLADERDLNSPWDNVWYLPMSLVFNYNKSPPKPRIVYDASAKFQGVSLNNFLLKGPDLLIDQLKPLLRMRLYRVAFTADVQQMYHRMRISLRDQQCQRILWRENYAQPFKTLVLSVMAFGPTCSPFVSQFIKNWNADRWQREYPRAAKAMKELTFMDDVLAGEPSVEKAVITALQCIQMCKRIDWNLVSFQSNSAEFLRQLPGENVKSDIFPILSSEIETYTAKVLGCNWDTIKDAYTFSFDKNLFIRLVNEFKHNPTKRELASTIARIYDIFGFLAHYVIRGRIILQRCWKLKLDWDEKVPDEIQRPWQAWLGEIENVSKLKIARMYANFDTIADADSVQLHTFCDAGKEAFGTVAYLVVHKDEAVSSHIVMARAKVTPINLSTKTEVQKMPRLELMAALLAARMGTTIASIYNDLKLERFFWGDSEVVLRWILNPDHNLIKYAVAPIEEILETTKREEWRYVPTHLNVADECTKFQDIDFGDSKSRWFVGPEFIRRPRGEWPELPEKLSVDFILMANNMYLRKLNFSTHTLPPRDLSLFVPFFDNARASIKADWGKLVRYTARALKIFYDGFVPLVIAKQLHNKKTALELKKLHNSFRTLTAADIERGEHFIFRHMQRETYGKDYENLANGKTVRNHEFQQLNVFLDEQGIIRINSRVDLNSNAYPQQYVPLLPRKNGLIPILLLHYHYKFKHIAVESQIAELRTKCWIPQIRTAMRKLGKCCNACNYLRAKPYGPAMAQLPSFRVDPDLRPFEVTGVDCLGPIVVRVHGRPKKIWVMIFACTVTRFIDLHILDSLESLRVLEAIVTFWCAHGPVRQFISDRGTNFRGAARVLKEDFESAEKIQQAARALGPRLSEEYSVDWMFIPAHSPWFGAFYERLIKEVKRSIHDTLSEKKIDKVTLNIAIKEAAHRINLRPLTHNSIDAADDTILTPHHLAKGRSGWPLLPGMHKGTAGQLDDRLIYRRGRAMADQIMAKFVAHYLPVLTKRTKWVKDDAPLKVNDLVLLIEPNKTRQEWPRAIVTRIYKNKDRKGRVADVKLSTGVVRLSRSVRNLARIQLNPVPASI